MVKCSSFQQYLAKKSNVVFLFMQLERPMDFFFFKLLKAVRLTHL